MPGANPTIVSYNATHSQVRFKNNNIFSTMKNGQAYYVQRWRCSSKFRSHTIASYKASAVKIYNATGSLLRFENKSNFYKFEETLLPTTTPALQLQIPKS
jgi:hypothetical protein